MIECDKWEKNEALFLCCCVDLKYSFHHIFLNIYSVDIQFKQLAYDTKPYRLIYRSCGNTAKMVWFVWEKYSKST
jgi:hypothetical protein